MSKGLGSGDDGGLTFIDLLSLLSFAVGLQNLEINISQSDLQVTAEHLNSALKTEVEDIHKHLIEQDKMLQKILFKENGGLKYDDR